jgi:hypothetical protein
MQEHGAGWIMSDGEWEDEAQMLQRILTLLDPAHDAMLQEKATRASQVSLPTMNAMVASTVACYAQALATAPRVSERCSFPLVRVRDALGYTEYPMTGGGLEEARNGRGALCWQWAARFRQTPAGRALRAVLPQSLINGLKKFIKR